MRYLIIALLLWSCSSNIQQLPEPDFISYPSIIIRDPEQLEIMDSAFTIKFKCYPFHDPRYENHYIKWWQLVTDEGYELLDTNLTEEHELVDLKFKKPGGHWIGISAMQENGNVSHEIIHIITR